ncbi:hypothetical protein BDR26DRAFT_873380 [Obelidium mucronatum]|nr:hypothetical protein BDR26DRAFT_873380 [Obelidium mucronatum]
MIRFYLIPSLLDSDDEHSNDSLSSDETDHNNDNDDINNHHINSPNFKTISIPSSSTSYPPFHFRHASAKPTSAGGSATFRFNGNSSTTSSPSRSFIKLPTSISRASTLNNIGHSPGSASLSASPRSSFIHHTLTSGCDLGKKLKDHTPRETVIQALLSLESAPAAATNGASAATNSSNSSNSSVVGGAGEDAIQFLRQVSSIGGSGSGIVAELSNVSQAVAYSNCTISRLLHENGL